MTCVPSVCSAFGLGRGVWALLAVASATIGTIACGGERAVTPTPAPGGPAYWESQVPAEPPRPPPGTRFDNWPSLDGGVSPEGSRDKFLWEDSQIPQGAVPLGGDEAPDAGADATPPRK